MAHTQKASNVELDLRETTGRRRRAVLSAYLGFMMDSYAIVVPSVALVPALIYFQTGADPAGVAIFASLTVTATLLGRPIGAFVFGALSDKVGRQRIGFITIFGFGMATVLIACLPGAELVGAPAAMGLLLVLRFVDGIFLGGEYTAATPLAMEYARSHRRGLIGGIVQSSANTGQALAAILVAVTLAFTTAGDASSSYSRWGWRIPFVVGGILAIAVAIFLRREVPDSDVQISAPKVKNPLRTLFAPGPNLSALLQAFIIMSGIFFTISLLSSVMVPSILLGNSDVITPQVFSLITTVGALIGIVGYILSGWVSDRIGRKRTLAIGALISAVGGSLAMATVGSGTLGGSVAIGAMYTVATVSVGLVAGVVPSYLSERFPTAVRSSGWGIGYSTAIVIPSFVAVYIAGLERFVPSGTGGSVFWALGCVLILIGLAMGPETRGSDLTRVGS